MKIVRTLLAVIAVTVLAATGGGVWWVRTLGPVPGLANRSPSYLARQLYDFQQGTRAGVWSPLMKPVVANLTVEDMVNILAYTASRRP